MICTPGNLARDLFSIKTKEGAKIVHQGISVLRKNNVGKKVGNQKVEYSKEDFVLLRKISSFLVWLDRRECKHFRTTKETEEMVKSLLASLRQNKKILFFALFCPSYKKGRNVKGFNEEIGNTTRRGIDNLSSIYSMAKFLQIPCEAKAIYGDLALENFNKLNKGDFDDLETNFENFKIFGEKVNSDIGFIKLSDIGACKEVIGLSGITGGDIPLDSKEIKRIAKRSNLFYREILGWKDRDIVKRTEDLARTCSFITGEIRETNPLSIMVMTENIYERAKFYQGGEQNKTLPIFYPAKIKC